MTGMLDLFSDLSFRSVPAAVDTGGDDPPVDDGDGPEHKLPPLEWSQPVPTQPSTGTPGDGLILTGEPCDVCGGPVYYGGRGRKPKRCLDHRTRNRATKATAPPAPVYTTEVPDDEITAVVGDLQRGLGMIAGGLIPFAPVTGATIMLTGPDAVNSLVSIAARYPKMLEGLKKASTAIPFLEIGKFGGAVVVAMMVDSGRALPEGLAAEYLGVAEAARQIGWQPMDEPEGIPVEGFVAPRAPSFSM